MKIVLKKQDALKAFTLANSVATKSVFGATSFALIEAKTDGGQEDCVSVVATDTMVSVRVFCPCNVVEGGSALVPCKKLLDIISATDADITLETTEKGIAVKTRSRFTLKTMAVDKFPQVQFDEKGTRFKAEDLRRALAFTLPSAAQGTAANSNLQNIRFEKANGELNIIASDSRRMSVAKIACTEGGDFSGNVPTKTIRTALSFGWDGDEALLGIDDKCFCLSVGNVAITSPLAGQQYPNWKYLLDKTREKNTRQISFPIAEMKAACADAATTLGDDGMAQFDFSDNAVKILSQCEQGEGESVAQSSGGNISFKTLLPFMRDFIASFALANDCENITLSFCDDSSAMTVESEQMPDFVHVFMPSAK